MSSTLLAALILTPFTFAVANMLWNLTMELQPTKRDGDSQRVIPIWTFTHETTRPMKVSSPRTSSEVRAVRN
jgi:hypothetical protein